MKLFSFPRLFGRRQAVKPATMQNNDNFPPGRPVRELRGDVVLTLDDYRPKHQPAATDATVLFLLSLPREKQLKLARLLRHGYRLGVAVAAPAPMVEPMRMAA